MATCEEGVLTSRGCRRLFVDSTDGGVPFTVQPQVEPIVVELPVTGGELHLVGVALVMIVVGMLLARWRRAAS